jgi:hypothetical protein
MTVPERLLAFQSESMGIFQNPVGKQMSKTVFVKRGKLKMINSLKIILQIGIVAILFPVSGCKKAEPDNLLEVTTDEIEIFSEGIYIFKGTIVSIGKEGVNLHGF